MMYFIDWTQDMSFIEAIYKFDNESLSTSYGTNTVSNSKPIFINKKAEHSLWTDPDFTLYVDSWQILHSKRDVIADIFET